MYREENPDKVKESKKEWYTNNKDKAIELTTKWYQENKDRVCERVKEYRIANIGKINAQKREYYERKKDDTNQRTRLWASERAHCECGVECRKDWLSRHRKSKAHMKWVELQRNAEIDNEHKD